MELDIKKYEAILKAQLVDFTKKQEDALCQLRELPNEGIGMSDSADQAQLMERQHLLNSQATRFSLRIKSVRKALKLIKDDEYGFCHSCGIDIPEEELEKHPEREFCIECLKLSDARSKHYSK